jgi:hypothetical protein
MVGHGGVEARGVGSGVRVGVAPGSYAAGAGEAFECVSCAVAVDVEFFGYVFGGEGEAAVGVEELEGFLGEDAFHFQPFW